MFTVVGIAVAGTAVVARTVPVDRVDLVRFGVLAAAAVVHIAAVHIGLRRQVERQREYVRVEGTPFIDTKSAWSFAALIVLPPALALAMVVWTYLVAWWRFWPGTRPEPLYRWVFSAATVLLATQVAVAVLAAGMWHHPGPLEPSLAGGARDLAVLTAAGLVRWAINTGLVYVALALSTPGVTVRTRFANAGEYVLEAGALALGVLTAAVLVSFPVLLAAIVVVLIALHRGLLVWQFQLQSRLDGKTALASPRWWTQATEKLLAAARTKAQAVGVLVVDVDHFKTVNDTFGHPVGDRVLRAVADAIRGEIRNEDLAGRYGGDEFAVAVPAVTDRDLVAIADRIRRRIAAIRIDDHLPADDPARGRDAAVTVSIGAACYHGPAPGSLDELVRAADTALYRAKKAGRDRVHLGQCRTGRFPGPRTAR
ncbi:diguanylate cyclase (GGDEF) domain-containing protein [Amycolatopsis arida]|uniref:Diguanylate cyclase (GGDEF) domain-containing protein n=1 Tax=Amycolatopsis arida TaxID=587909 RepID=A0A1I5S8H5_9PSEU|nr:GGDEF domain-containing protein [Amycolatopsis arida]TDX85319.1 diguanylate cyclase (GGDEF)-like protein [Amycolatopsis arida]SFP67003.1 diguanylate cyclase (GGDEF) domain-containing protein [Amycolatopsis arida]